MRASDKAIVLQAIKHGDHKYIVKLYTHDHGLITASAIAGKSATSKIKTSHLLPLNFIEVQYTYRQNREIQQMAEAYCYQSNTGLQGSMAKLSIAQLINEVLIKTLKDQQPNQYLFEFIETCLAYLNNSPVDFMGLHLYFLVELTRYLGFEPHNNLSDTNPYFDCRNGEFSPLSLAFPLGLNKEDSLMFSNFLKADTLKIKLTAQQRNHLLESLLAYYTLHVPGFGDLKSLEVLRDVMYS